MPDRDRSELHALLGAAPDLSAERLRLLYEQHMNAAVRGSDRRRALELSRAFDALPAALRRAMYASSVPEDRWLPANGRPASRWRRKRPTRRRLPGDDPRWRTPLVVVTAIVLVVGFLWWQGAFVGL